LLIFVKKDLFLCFSYYFVVFVFLFFLITNHYSPFTNHYSLLSIFHFSL